MTPSKQVADTVPTALIATGLGGVTDGRVGLVKQSFTPSEDLVFADLIPADFNGASPGGHSTPTWGVDPLTNERVVNIPPLAGGFHWETVDTSELPQTIYGFMLYDSDATALLGCALLDTPIVLNAANQAIDLDKVQFRLPSGFMQ